MDGRIGRIVKLSGDKSIGDFGSQRCCLVDSPLHAQSAGSEHQLGSVRLQQITAFLGHGFGHGQDRTVAAG